MTNDDGPKPMTQAHQELDSAQRRFASRHGESAMRRLFEAIEAVVQCAPLRGWTESFFYGSAIDLYLGLLEAEEVTAAAMGTILEEHLRQMAGPSGWETLRHCQVAVTIWQRDSVHGHSSLDRHRGFVSGADRYYLDSYESGLREFVRSALESYYFDHWEHADDVSHALQLAGRGHPCDGHGVASFFNARAPVAHVRSIYDKIKRCPRTITLEIYLEAVDVAYRAALAEGHSGDLRAFVDVAADIDRHAPYGRYSTDKDQRRVDPHDDSSRHAPAPIPPPSVARPDGRAEAQVDDSLSAQEMGNVIIKTVVNVQQNQNAIGVQVSKGQVDEVADAVKKAPPSALKRALKEWVPQAVIGATVVELLKILLAL